MTPEDTFSLPAPLLPPIASQPGASLGLRSVETEDNGPAAPAIFEVEGLSFYYGTAKVLHSVNLAIPEGEVTALIGPSGCGKTTFLRCLNRMNDLIPSTRVEGEVRYRGSDLYAATVRPVDVRRRIGMVFQRPTPFPKSIYDNVAFAPRLHGARRQDLDAIVETSLRRAALWDEVKDKLRKSAFTLSGGQQQRLCIARALAVDPDVLLMDEPCSALDPIATRAIEELIRSLSAACTIVIVTHNLAQALRVADRTAFFSAGELVETGRTEELFSRPADPRTAEYVAGRFG